jgi:undecaprenyl-diphosphatase
VLRLLVSYQLPVSLAFAIPLGAAVGSFVLFAFGRPDRRPTVEAIGQALRESGLRLTEVHPAKVDARGSTPYFATLDDGTGLFVKVLGSDQRAADLLFRVYRFLRLKNVGDDRPYSSLRRTVEHEALVSLMARDLGVRTPRMRGVVQVGGDSMLLAQDMIPGTSVDRLPDDAITDELMRKVWEQIELLRRHRIAHRDLRRANVFVGDDGEPWMIDFGFSELAVSDGLLRADVAQMLASFVVVASPERVVKCAIDVVGRDAVAEALPRLQINALSGATQSALRQRKGLLRSLQQEVMRQCDQHEVRFEQLQRFNRKTIVTIAVLAGVTYFLAPQFADLPSIIDRVKDARWSWLPVTLLMSAITYVGATFSLGGAVPQHVRPGPLFATQVGSSFASKVAPAGLGGMALNIRFLQKQGVEEPVAVSAVGLNTVAGLVGHLTLMLVFLVWAGSAAFRAFHLPDPKWFLVALGGIGVAAGLGVAVPTLRRRLVGTLWPIVRRALTGVADVLRHPTKVVSLLGGSMLVTTSYITALYFSTQAFGGGLPLATVGAVYLVGGAIAAAAPTPGGLGAVEAALIAGLVAAGMSNTVAVPAVFLYRLCTFWVPILPGWACFTWLRRTEHI